MRQLGPHGSALAFYRFNRELPAPGLCPFARLGRAKPTHAVGRDPAPKPPAVVADFQHPTPLAQRSEFDLNQPWPAVLGSIGQDFLQNPEISSEAWESSSFSGRLRRTRKPACSAKALA